MPLITDSEMDDFDAVILKAGFDVNDFHVVDLEDEPTAKEQHPITGTVTHYYNHLHVAGVTITDGELHKGDTIHVKGNTSDFEQKVESMEIDNEAVEVTKPGDQIGLVVIEYTREHDTIYKVT